MIQTILCDTCVVIDFINENSVKHFKYIPNIKLFVP